MPSSRYGFGVQVGTSTYADRNRRNRRSRRSRLAAKATKFKLRSTYFYVGRQLEKCNFQPNKFPSTWVDRLKSWPAWWFPAKGLCGKIICFFAPAAPLLARDFRWESESVLFDGWDGRHDGGGMAIGGDRTPTVCLSITNQLPSRKLTRYRVINV
jgi:hypothetical protein